MSGRAESLRALSFLPRTKRPLAKSAIVLVLGSRAQRKGRYLTADQLMELHRAGFRLLDPKGTKSIRLEKYGKNYLLPKLCFSKSGIGKSKELLGTMVGLLLAKHHSDETDTCMDDKLFHALLAYATAEDTNYFKNRASSDFADEYPPALGGIKPERMKVVVDSIDGYLSGGGTLASFHEVVAAKYPRYIAARLIKSCSDSPDQLAMGLFKIRNLVIEFRAKAVDYAALLKESRASRRKFVKSLGQRINDIGL